MQITEIFMDYYMSLVTNLLWCILEEENGGGRRKKPRFLSVCN